MGSLHSGLFPPPDPILPSSHTSFPISFLSFSILCLVLRGTPSDTVLSLESLWGLLCTHLGLCSLPQGLGPSGLWHEVEAAWLVGCGQGAFRIGD